MAKIKLTVKSLNAGKLTPNIPPSEVSITLDTGIFVELVLGSTLTLLFIDAGYAFLQFNHKSSTDQGSTHQLQFRKSDGVTVLDTITFSDSLAYASARSSALLRVGLASDWIGVRVYWKRTNGTVTTGFIQANSIVGFHAQKNNIIDTDGIRWHIDDIKFYSLNNSEGLHGILSVNTDIDFVTLSLNSIVSKLIWSANSGDTLWDWSGQTLGIEP